MQAAMASSSLGEILLLVSTLERTKPLKMKPLGTTDYAEELAMKSQNHSIKIGKLHKVVVSNDGSMWKLKIKDMSKGRHKKWLTISTGEISDEDHDLAGMIQGSQGRTPRRALKIALAMQRGARIVQDLGKHKNI